MRSWVFSIACAGWLALLALPGSALALSPVLSFGSSSAEPGALSSPGGIALGPDGSAYVADTGNNRISVYSPSGVYLRSLGNKAVPVGGGDCKREDGNSNCDDGSGAAGVLRSPRDVAVDAAGNAYVADTGNSRIDVFAPSGGFVRAFGKGVNPAGGDVCTTATGCQRGTGNAAPGGLSSPLGIAVDAAGLVYVTSSLHVDVFTAAGSYIRSLGREPTASQTDGGKDCSDSNRHCNTQEYEMAGAINAPYDAVVSASGQVFVADFGNDRVDVFGSDGSFVRALGKDVNPAGGDLCTEATGCKKGTEGGAAGAVSNPTGVALSGSGSLVVADSASNRIDEFNAAGSFVRAFGEGVASGASEFQVCTASGGCRPGLASVANGSVAGPRGTAVDCAGGIFSVEWSPGSDKTGSDRGGVAFSRVERFAEPNTGVAPCPAPAAGGPDGPGSSAAAGDAGPGAAKHTKPAKPLISIALNKAAGTATLIVIVSDAGTLVLGGKGIHKVTQEVKRPGETELQVTPVGKLKQKLQAAGKAKVKISLAFKAQGGSVVQAKAIVLKKVGGF